MWQQLAPEFIPRRRTIFSGVAAYDLKLIASLQPDANR